MSRPGHLHLNAFLMGVGHHEAAWRLPESDPHAHVDVQHYQNLARIAERGKLDSLFLADGPVLWDELRRRPATLLLGSAMLGSWMLVPLLVAQPAGTGIGFGATPAVVGLVMLPTAVGTLLVMPVGRRLSSRRGSRATLLLGAATAGIAQLLLAVAHDSLVQVGLAVLLMDGGVGLAFSAVGALVVEAVPRAQTAASAGVNTVMRTASGSIGATVGGTMLSWSMSPAGYPTEQAYTAVLLMYAAALAGAVLCASRVPQPPAPAAGRRAHRDDRPGPVRGR